MNVLSLFDGISCGQLALRRAGVMYDNYFASEIKPSAIAVTKHHFPQTKNIGSVLDVKGSDLPKIDLLIGGSPCQDFSLMKTTGKGLEGDKSRLFYEYLRLLKETKPRYFFLENVKMKKDSKQQLDDYLGITGVEINSSLVSYQNRPRVYWSNIPFEMPTDKHLCFQDFKETTPEIEAIYAVKRTPSREKMWNGGKGKNDIGSCANVTNSQKIYCISRKQDRAPNAGLIEHGDFCRYLTRRELEQGQTLPVGYTNILSYTQAQDVIGDGWTVDVVAHVFAGLVEPVTEIQPDLFVEVV